VVWLVGCELFGDLLRGEDRRRQQQDLHSGARPPFGDLGLLRGDLLAAEALVGDGDVALLVVAFVVDPVGFAGAALRAGSAQPFLVGEGLEAVAWGPGAVSDAEELAVRDAVLAAQREFVT